MAYAPAAKILKRGECSGGRGQTSTRPRRHPETGDGKGEGKHRCAPTAAARYNTHGGSEVIGGLTRCGCLGPGCGYLLKPFGAQLRLLRALPPLSTPTCYAICVLFS